MTAADIDPSLLDVVPWSYGYAHSWAVAALLDDPRTQAALLGAIEGIPGPRPHSVDGGISREKGIKPARADLAFKLVDGNGDRHNVAFETKVNDPFHESQVQAYKNAGWLPLLYLPGATGVLLGPTPVTDAGEIRLMPELVLLSMDATELTFGPLLGGYLEALRSEHARAQHALALARGEALGPIPPGESDARMLADVAWLAETFRSLPRAAAGSGLGSAASMRIAANDRGFFYTGSYYWFPDEGALWVDLFADVRSGRRAVAIKAGENPDLKAWDRASGADSPGPAWRPGRRLRRAAQCTVWKRDLDDACAFDAAKAAVEGASFIRRVTGGAPQES